MNFDRRTLELLKGGTLVALGFIGLFVLDKEPLPVLMVAVFMILVGFYILLGAA